MNLNDVLSRDTIVLFILMPTYMYIFQLITLLPVVISLANWPYCIFHSLSKFKLDMPLSKHLPY